MAGSPTFYPKQPTGMGGSTGAGGTGADLSALGFVSVDLSSGWTLNDPDNLVASVSHSAGVNTVTMAALGTGSLDYAWSNSSTMRAPRWHKELKIADANGTEQQIKTGDSYVLQVVMEFQEPVDRFATQIVIGTAADATATASTSVDLVGGIIQYPASGNPTGGGFGQQTSSLAPANANYHRSLVICSVSAGRMNSPTYINTRSDGTVLASGQRATNVSYADLTTNVDLLVGLGTSGSATISAGEDAKLKLWYRVVRTTMPT